MAITNNRISIIKKNALKPEKHKYVAICMLNSSVSEKGKKRTKKDKIGEPLRRKLYNFREKL